jgi:hypothetical protein
MNKRKELVKLKFLKLDDFWNEIYTNFYVLKNILMRIFISIDLYTYILKIFLFYFFLFG